MGCSGSKSRHQVVPDVDADSRMAQGMPPKPKEQPQEAAVPGREWQVADGLGPAQGDIVFFEGQKCTVQYVNSKGLLDLRSEGGDVHYGVGSVTLSVSTAPAAASAAALAAATATPAAASEAAFTASAATTAAPATAAPATVAAPAAASAPLLGVLGEQCGAKGGSGALVYACSGGVAREERCAVKLLNRSTALPDQIEAIEKEATLCATLHDVAIVRFVHTSCAATIPGIDGACIAIVMQMLPVTLEQLIVARAAAEPRRHFSSTRLLGISAQVGDGLKYLHGLEPPVLHRDLKPGNLFLEAGALELDAELENEDDEGVAATWVPRVRLGDFDMARATAEPVNEFVGTPSTMPPEMFAFADHFTPADVWALGMTLQWCLLLEDTFADADMPVLEKAISTSPPAIPLFTPPHAWPGHLEPVAAVARKCCATDPAARPPIATVCELLSVPAPPSGAGSAATDGAEADITGPELEVSSTYGKT